MRNSLLTIAAVALFVSCATAPAASGQPAFTISAPGKVKGERQGSDRFVAHGIEANCKGLLFLGELRRSSTTLALTPENYECRAKVLNELPADFYHDYACDYILHDLQPIGEIARWRADVDIECPGEDTGFAFEMYETLEELAQVCALWFLEQPDAGTAELRNLGGQRGGIEVRWDLPELKYEVSTPEGGPSLLCGSLPASPETDASYAGTATIFGHDSKGNPLDLRLTD